MAKKQNSPAMCYGVPVRATIRIIDGEPVIIEAGCADIPADVIARFLIQKFGYDGLIDWCSRHIKRFRPDRRLLCL